MRLSPTDTNSVSSEATSEELARRARLGCALAFAELSQRFRPRLLAVLERRFSGRFSDAEDIAQETFTRAWQKISHYDDRYRFSTWLFTIALRLATDFHRREVRRQQDVELTVDPVDPAKQNFDVSDEAQNIWAVANAVLGLSLIHI